MFQQDRRFFSVASVLLFLTGVAHTFAFLQPPPTNDASVAASVAMQASRMPLGLGMTPSVADVFHSLAFTMSIALFWLALTNLVVAGSGADARLIRRLRWLSIGGVGALVALSWSDRIPPPLITFALILLAFLASLGLDRAGGAASRGG